MTQFDKQKAKRDKVDARYSGMPARPAFREWLDANKPLTDYWWKMWDEELLDRNYWPSFLAGWNARKP